MIQKKRIAIFGSTGSIGTQALEVIAANPTLFSAEILTAQTNDELLVDISGNSEANYRLKVSPEGIIKIPVAGPVQVNGLTIEQAKKTITNKLAANGYSAIRTGKTSVDVTLGSIRSIKVVVIGEANIPGTYTLPSVATVFHALYACGGPGPSGSFRNIQLLRNNAIIAEIDKLEKTRIEVTNLRRFREKYQPLVLIALG